MAKKDHSLDALIVEAARGEFMEHGFQKASLHKIADRAGITTGALYTRYRSKDDLFRSLVQPVLTEISAHLEPMAALYMQAHQARSAEMLLRAIQTEEQIYLDLLFTNYEACVLLLCKSGGSALEAGMNDMMQKKSSQTVAFFKSMARQEIDGNGIELIMTAQFDYFRQILLRGYSREDAVSCMKTVDLFLEAGWKAILERIL